MRCFEEPIMVGIGNNWRHWHDVSRDVGYLTQRDCRDLFYNAARIRKRNGNIEGAKRMNFGAQCVSGDSRKRHDQ